MKNTNIIILKYILYKLNKIKKFKSKRNKKLSLKIKKKKVLSFNKVLYNLKLKLDIVFNNYILNINKLFININKIYIKYLLKTFLSFNNNKIIIKELINMHSYINLNKLLKNSNILLKKHLDSISLLERTTLDYHSYIFKGNTYLITNLKKGVKIINKSGISCRIYLLSLLFFVYNKGILICVIQKLKYLSLNKILNLKKTNNFFNNYNVENGLHLSDIYYNFYTKRSFIRPFYNESDILDFSFMEHYFYISKKFKIWYSASNSLLIKFYLLMLYNNISNKNSFFFLSSFYKFYDTQVGLFKELNEKWDIFEGKEFFIVNYHFKNKYTYVLSHSNKFWGVNTFYDDIICLKRSTYTDSNFLYLDDKYTYYNFYM